MRYRPVSRAWSPWHSYHSAADYQDLGEPARGQEGQRLADRRATCNADMMAKDVLALSNLTPRGKEVLYAAMRQLHLSARGYHRVLKVSRTIADLEGADLIDTPTPPRPCSAGSTKATTH